MPSEASLEQLIKREAGRLGFVLAGFAAPDPPAHFSKFREWIRSGRHATMDYLAKDRAVRCREDPRRIMPECRSILVLAAPYSNPGHVANLAPTDDPRAPQGRIAAYAWGRDYHAVFGERVKIIVAFIEAKLGRAVGSTWYTDTGPILERELAQRAGLGWIGKNTCLIHPTRGSYILIAEILLDVKLTPDAPFAADRCGKCTRCIDACPTDCILGDRTLDASRCISYLTIELKEAVPVELRTQVGTWLFGCDICQMVCPWNRFGGSSGDPEFADQSGATAASLLGELARTVQQFNEAYKESAIRRARSRGFRRNALTVLGNQGTLDLLPAVQECAGDPDPMIREHAAWAADQIALRAATSETTPDRNQ